MRFLSKIKVNEILPVAIGAVGAAYYAFQARDSSPGSPLYDKQVARDLFERSVSFIESRSGANRDAQWSKRVETGRLFAIAALGAGALYAKFKAARKSR